MVNFYKTTHHFTIGQVDGGGKFNVDIFGLLGSGWGTEILDIFWNNLWLGATSINKIGEVRLSDEIGGGGVWNSEKTELYNYY